MPRKATACADDDRAAVAVTLAGSVP